MKDNKVIYPTVIERVTRNYPAILRRCAERLPRQRGELTIYDIVHDTVLRIIHDHRAAMMDSDKEFINYFLYRTNVIIYKTTHDRKLLHKAYANYHQAQETATDE